MHVYDSGMVANDEWPTKYLAKNKEAALAYLYKRIKETDPIREAHHIAVV